MTIPRGLRRPSPEPVQVEEDVLDEFAERLAECDDPVKAGHSLGMGPMKATAVMLTLRHRLGDQAR